MKNGNLNLIADIARFGPCILGRQDDFGSVYSEVLLSGFSSSNVIEIGISYLDNVKRGEPA